MPSPLSPPPSLLCKLGSAIVHMEEIQGGGAHYFDAQALAALLKDPEVVSWMREMNALGLLPVKRS